MKLTEFADGKCIFSDFIYCDNKFSCTDKDCVYFGHKKSVQSIEPKQLSLFEEYDKNGK